MSRTVYRPSPPLDRLVDFLWVSDECHAQTARERVLPSGGQALVIPLDQRPLEVFADDRTVAVARFDDGVMCGARSTPMIIGSALGPTVGIRFKPGGARPFFDVQAYELMNRVIPLEALCGGSARSLRDRLAGESAPNRRARVLEEFLIARVHRSLALPPALCASLYAFENRNLASVAEVNRQTGLSPKRLLSLFYDAVGLNPKAYWRVRRFRAVLRNLECGSLRGAALATEYRYFDQAHLFREFRALSGSSPREYVAARVAGTDHVAVPGKNIQY